MTKEEILKMIQEKSYLVQQTEIALYQLKGQIVLLREMLAKVTEEEKGEENKKEE